jgi:hypothetical protein
VSAGEKGLKRVCRGWKLVAGDSGDVGTARRIYGNTARTIAATAAEVRGKHWRSAGRIQLEEKSIEAWIQIGAKLHVGDGSASVYCKASGVTGIID